MYLGYGASGDGFPRIADHKSAEHLVVTVERNANRSLKLDLNHGVHLFREASKKEHAILSHMQIFCQSGHAPD